MDANKKTMLLNRIEELQKTLAQEAKIEPARNVTRADLAGSLGAFAALLREVVSAL